MDEDKSKLDNFADLRRRAEASLQQQLEDIAQLPPQTLKDLVHELQVHQIELDMQNEELRLAQQQLEESRDKYLNLYDFAPVGYFTLNEQGLILQANLTVVAMLGLTRADLIKRPLTRFIVPEDQNIYYFHRQKLLETQAPQVCELRLIKKDGSQLYARLEATVGQDSQTKGICRVAASDISKAKLIEDLLRQSEEQYHRIVDTAQEGIWIVDKEAKTTFVNQYMAEMLGYPEQEMMNRPLFDFMDSAARVKAQHYFERCQQGIKERHDFRFCKRDGSDLWTISATNPMFDDNGQFIGMLAMLTNITERKRMEDQINVALAEKETLLKEVYHRVKNNLNSLSYLIDMQANTTTTPEVCQALVEIQGRLRAIGLVHQKLYQAQDLAHIDFGIYLQDVTTNLHHALAGGRFISLNIEAENIAVEASTAITCGLIVNELVTNALKYAFPEKRERENKIRVGFACQHGQYILTVSDNGIGLPMDLDWRTRESLGLWLVNLWSTQQLQGDLNVDTRDGTTFTLRFSEQQ